eukprot:365875-Chlamydomonas_euryale.AAC.3
MPAHHRHAELVRSDWVKPGAVVVDVGINVRPAAPAAGNSGDADTTSAGKDGGSGTPPAEAVSQPPGQAGAEPSMLGGTAGTHGSMAAGTFTSGAYQVVGDVAFDDVAKVCGADTSGLTCVG